MSTIAQAGCGVGSKVERANACSTATGLQSRAESNQAGPHESLVTDVRHGLLRRVGV